VKIRIVTSKEAHSGILGKFALKLQEHIAILGHKVDIGYEPDDQADINHYILYLIYDLANHTSIDSLLITHVDRPSKLKLLKTQLKGDTRLGICMSRETMNLLLENGIPKNKLCYINPAHDSKITPKKINIGITSAVYADGRKRENYILKISSKIDPSDFKFTIMGAGWENIITDLKNKNFIVDYYSEFNYENYNKIIPTFDYYLYLGQDEGSMGFIDALYAGVKTIVTPQGYHLDVENGITHSFNNYKELIQILKRIAENKNKLQSSVEEWTWANYGMKHLEVWEYLLTNKNPRSTFKDGINSLLNSEQSRGISLSGILNTRFKLLQITTSRFINSTDKMGKIERKFKNIFK